MRGVHVLREAQLCGSFQFLFQLVSDVEAYWMLQVDAKLGLRPKQGWRKV